MTSNTRSKLESHIEKKCCEIADANGFEHIKLDKAKRSWPDRLFLGPLCVSFIVEFKRPGEKTRPQQAALHRRLGRLGHDVYVIDSVEAFRELINC